MLSIELLTSVSRYQQLLKIPPLSWGNACARILNVLVLLHKITTLSWGNACAGILNVLVLLHNIPFVMGNKYKYFECTSSVT